MSLSIYDIPLEIRTYMATFFGDLKNLCKLRLFRLFDCSVQCFYCLKHVSLASMHVYHMEVPVLMMKGKTKEERTFLKCDECVFKDNGYTCKCVLHHKRREYFPQSKIRREAPPKLDKILHFPTFVYVKSPALPPLTTLQRSYLNKRIRDSWRYSKS